MRKKETNEDILRALYADYGGDAYRTAFGILNNRSDAEDAVQVTFEKALKNLHRIQINEREKTRHLITIISRNAAIDILRARGGANGAAENVELMSSPESEDTADIVIRRETMREMTEQIKLLPHIYRDVFLLRVAYGCSSAETAELLGISDDAVRQRLSRARKKLIDALRKEGYYGNE